MIAPLAKTNPFTRGRWVKGGFNSSGTERDCWTFSFNKVAGTELTQRGANAKIVQKRKMWLVKMSSIFTLLEYFTLYMTIRKNRPERVTTFTSLIRMNGLSASLLNATQHEYRSTVNTLASPAESERRSGGAFLS